MPTIHVKKFLKVTIKKCGCCIMDVTNGKEKFEFIAMKKFLENKQEKLNE